MVLSSSLFANCSVSDIIAVYDGFIQGGGDRAETAFYTNRETGELAGVYYMISQQEQARQMISDLSSKSSMSPRSIKEYAKRMQIDLGHLEQVNLQGTALNAVWFDRFGSGTLEVDFESDCNSFSGIWFDSGIPSGTWSGQKTE